MKKHAMTSLIILLFKITSLLAITNQDGDIKNYPIDQVDLSDKVIPSVVFIAVEYKYYDDSDADSIYSLYGYLHPFYEYLWPSDHAHGSGFVMNAEGHIVTCAHVVENATHIRVVMRDSEFRMYEGKIIGIDQRSDVAVIKIESETEFPFLELRDSNAARVGETVLAIGSPLYSENETTVTRGIISAKERNNFGMYPLEGYIQTDAIIRGGNSGGPLLDLGGNVLGIISLGGLTGLGWAVPSHTIINVSSQLIEKGEVSQGFLGVELDLTQDNAFDVYFFPRQNGAHVIKVIADSPADLLGIKAGDVIEEVNGYAVLSAESLRNQICVLEEYTTVDLVISRDGVKTRCSIQLGSRELSETHSRLPGFSFFSFRKPRLVI